jgi:hypothetical protein
MRIIGKLLKTVRRATMPYDVPADHAYSRESMAEQKAVGASQSRAQWAALKSVALMTQDARLIAVILAAEAQARDAIAAKYGMKALIEQTAAQLDEQCGIALRAIPATPDFKTRPEVREAFAAVGYSAA